jgi:hypothetical protein
MDESLAKIFVAHKAALRKSTRAPCGGDFEGLGLAA